jgi:molybdopterin/thiamine biosynthesis adenylyltransferase
MDSAHLERFAGIGRLYGRAGMERLAGASFMIVGLGGVGSWTAEALARSGVGHLALVDGDSVCVSNTNRQLHAVAGNVGKAKTTAVAERARAIHPAIRTTEHPRFLSRFNPHEVLAGFDGVVIDAMDALSPKCGLIAEAEHLLRLNLDPELASARAVGYRATMDWLQGGKAVALDGLAERINLDTWALVRKQRKWFRRLGLVVGANGPA